MSFATVMAAIKTLEEGLSISAPVAISGGKVKVYLIAPSRAQALTEPVTFMNWPDASREDRMGNQREDMFTVQVDCLCWDTDFDQAAEIALNFLDAAWDAFDAERPAGQRLSQTVAYLTVRAERPMVEVITWGDKACAGFHLFLDIVLFKDVTP